MANFNLTAVPTFPEGVDVGLYDALRWGGRTPTSDPPVGGPPVAEEPMGPNGVLFEDVPDGDYFAGADVGGGVWRYVRVKADPEATAVVSGVTQEQLDAEIAARLLGDQDEAGARGDADTTEANTRAEDDDLEAGLRADADAAEATTRALVAAALADHEALTTSAHGGISAPEQFNVDYYGFDNTGAAACDDAMDALLALVNPATGSPYSRMRLKFGRGTYKFLRPMVLPGDRTIDLQGAGMHITTLSFPTELWPTYSQATVHDLEDFTDSPVYAIWRQKDTLGSRRFTRDLSITGPSVQATTTLSVATSGGEAVITVGSTAGFETTFGGGQLKVGGVVVTYTGKTGTTFTGCVGVPAKIVGTNVKADWGRYPCKMDGVLARSQDRIFDVRVSGFNNGVVVQGDHQYFRGLVFGGNRINMFWRYNQGGSPNFADSGVWGGDGSGGDQSIVNCQLDGGLLAGCGMDEQFEYITGCHFIGCHFGFGPYGFVRQWAPVSGAGTFMQAVLFVECGLEQIGNAFIYDNGNIDNIVGQITLVECQQDEAASSTARTAYAFQLKPSDYVIDADKVGPITVLGGSALISGGLVGCLRGRNFATSCVWVNVNGAPVVTKPTITTPTGTGNRMVRGEQQVRFYKLSGSCTKNDLMEDSSGGAVQATTGIPLGCAQQTLTGGSGVQIALAIEGQVDYKSNGVIAAYSYLKPDGGVAGAVKAASGATDAPLVGHSTAAASGGSVKARTQIPY